MEWINYQQLQFNTSMKMIVFIKSNLVKCYYRWRCIALFIDVPNASNHITSACVIAKTSGTYLRLCKQLYFKDGDMTEDDIVDIVGLGFN